jgi:hypothetical protein
VFKPLLEGYRYQLIQNPLFEEGQDIARLTADMKEEDFEQVALRLEQHVNGMISHLDTLEPELVAL